MFDPEPLSENEFEAKQPRMILVTGDEADFGPTAAIKAADGCWVLDKAPFLGPVTVKFLLQAGYTHYLIVLDAEESEENATEEDESHSTPPEVFPPNEPAPIACEISWLIVHALTAASLSPLGALGSICARLGGLLERSRPGSPNNMRLLDKLNQVSDPTTHQFDISLHSRAVEPGADQSQHEVTGANSGVPRATCAFTNRNRIVFAQSTRDGGVCTHIAYGIDSVVVLCMPLEAPIALQPHTSAVCTLYVEGTGLL